MVVAWTYAVSVNFVPAYTSTVDKVGQSQLGLENPNAKDEESHDMAPAEGDHGIGEKGKMDSAGGQEKWSTKEIGSTHVERSSL